MNNENKKSIYSRMKKKDLLILCGYRNIKAAYKDGINNEVDKFGNKYYPKITRKYLIKLLSL